jgi:hypothetical protein
MLKLSCLILASVGVVLAASSVRGDEYAVKTTVSPFFCKWDSVQQVLLCINDADSERSVGVEIYDSAGNELFRVYPMKDFPGAKRLSIWDAAATPDGVAIAGVLTLSEKTARQLTLVYGKQGQLLKLWNVAPYHQHLIASDAVGNIYAFGDRIDVGNGAKAPDYPLIEKYSPDGKVQAEFLARKAFNTDVTEVTPQTGLNRMQIVGGELVLLLTSVKQVLWFDSSGRQEQQVSLAKVLNDISTGYGGSPVEVMGFAVLGNGGYLTELRVQPKEAAENLPTLVVRISNDGQSFELLTTKRTQAELGYLEGLTNAGKAVFLRGVGASQTLLIADELPRN